MKKRMIALATMTIMVVSLFSAPFVYGKYTKTITVTEDLDLTLKNEVNYRLYYHSYNENGDYIYKTESYDSESDVVTFLPAPSAEENPYPTQTKGRTFLGWTLSGMDESANRSNIYRYGPGLEATATIGDLRTRQQNSGGGGDTERSSQTYWDDVDGTKAVHLFDLYNGPTMTMSAHPLDTYVGQNYPTSGGGVPHPGFKLESGRVYFHLENKSKTDLGFSSWQHWSLHSKTASWSFYFHPGIALYWGKSSMQYKYNSVPYSVNNYWMDRADVIGEGYALIYDSRAEIDQDFSVYHINPAPEGSEDVDSGSSSGGGGGCFASDTLITLANGEKAPIESLTAGDMLRVYDHEKGDYATAEILFIEEDGFDEYDVINLSFSDGSSSKFIYEHGLFDLTLNEYVYITPDNYAQFIGHTFATEQEGGFGEVTLTDAYVEKEYTGCYSLTTNYHLNYFVDSRFSMPGGIYGLFNFFEYDEDLKYEEEAMARDIERYGLYTAADFEGYLPEEVFNGIFPVPYLKVSVGKGLITYDGILAIIERYVVGHGLLEKLK